MKQSSYELGAYKIECFVKYDHLESKLTCAFAHVKQLILYALKHKYPIEEEMIVMRSGEEKGVMQAAFEHLMSKIDQEN